MLALDPEDRERTRWESLLGAGTTLALLWLGFIWPSAFTLVAMVALPAPFLFLTTSADPTWLRRRPRTRRYLIACFMVAIVCWIVQIAWLLRPGLGPSETDRDRFSMSLAGQ